MAKHSAGVLLFRRSPDGLEVLLAHPGGPFWARKDAQAWSIPKGEFEPEKEEPLAAALREFTEETGGTVVGAPAALTPLRQRSGKLVHAFAVEQDFDPVGLRSNTFSVEWPPRSGRMQTFPEVDRVGWFNLEAARAKLLPGQLGFLDQLEQSLAGGWPPPPAP